MKKLLVAATLVLLTACASVSQGDQINLIPSATLSSKKIVTDINFTLASQDIRNAQFVAVINTGKEQVLPLHARQNVRKSYETALYQQMFSQGFTMTVNSDNTLTLRIVQTVANVTEGPTNYSIAGKVSLQITAETPTGKFVKTYNGTANKTGPFTASTTDIEEVLNTVSSRVLAEIAKDKELLNYMKGNF